jgi:hypothetical protein
MLMKILVELVSSAVHFILVLLQKGLKHASSV